MDERVAVVILTKAELNRRQQRTKRCEQYSKAGRDPATGGKLTRPRADRWMLKGTRDVDRRWQGADGEMLRLRAQLQIKRFVAQIDGALARHVRVFGIEQEHARVHDSVLQREVRDHTAHRR